MRIKNIVALTLCVTASFGAGFIGSIFTMPAIPTWYSELAKPFFSPPNWIFGPVWSVLYLLMGVSAYVVWRKGWGNRKVKVFMQLFGLHLIVNTLWSIVFFGFQNPDWALVNILLLWAMIVLLILRGYVIDKRAGWLLIPYLAWVSFATILNASIVLLN